MMKTCILSETKQNRVENCKKPHTQIKCQMHSEEAQTMILLGLLQASITEM